MSLSSMDLLEFGPYRKPNDNPIYVSSESNHPHNVLRNIPVGINKRLSSISATKEIFDKAAPPYQEALKKSGFNYKLNYEPQSQLSSKNKNKRQRNIIWFNPPFSRGVATNIGQKFLEILDKNFPPQHPLHKIFNRNSVKMSYKCTANLARKIAAHNEKILNSEKNKEKEATKKSCNCRKKNECPVGGKCLQDEVVYQATVKRGDGV